MFNFNYLSFGLRAIVSYPEGSITSNLTRCGAISAILVLISSKESYGSGDPIYSDNALRICQSSLAKPGGD